MDLLNSDVQEVADRILHECCAQYEISNFDAGFIILDNLIKLSKVFATASTNEIILFSITRVRALGLYLQRNWFSTLSLLSRIHEECPHRDHRPIPQLADMLLLAAESYKNLQKFDEAMDYAKEAINLIHIRLESTKNVSTIPSETPPNHKNLNISMGPILTDDLARVVAYYTLGSILESCQLPQVAQEWYTRALQACTSNNISPLVTQLVDEAITRIFAETSKTTFNTSPVHNNMLKSSPHASVLHHSNDRHPGGNISKRTNKGNEANPKLFKITNSTTTLKSTADLITQSYLQQGLRDSKLSSPNHANHNTNGQDNTISPLRASASNVTNFEHLFKVSTPIKPITNNYTSPYRVPLSVPGLDGKRSKSAGRKRSGSISNNHRLIIAQVPHRVRPVSEYRLHSQPRPHTNGHYEPHLDPRLLEHDSYFNGTENSVSVETSSPAQLMLLSGEENGNHDSFFEGRDHELNDAPPSDASHGINISNIELDWEDAHPPPLNSSTFHTSNSTTTNSNSANNTYAILASPIHTKTSKTNQIHVKSERNPADQLLGRRGSLPELITTEKSTSRQNHYDRGHQPKVHADLTKDPLQISSNTNSSNVESLVFFEAVVTKDEQDKVGALSSLPHLDHSTITSTKDHKRTRVAAVTKIQALGRGFLVRMKLSAIKSHLEFLKRKELRHKAALKIQRRSQRYLLQTMKRQPVDKGKRREEAKVQKVQANVRGMLSRNQRLTELTKYVKELEGSIDDQKSQFSRDLSAFQLKYDENIQKYLAEIDHSKKTFEEREGEYQESVRDLKRKLEDKDSELRRAVEALKPKEREDAETQYNFHSNHIDENDVSDHLHWKRNYTNKTLQIRYTLSSRIQSVIKIQALIRGVLARMKIKAKKSHFEYLNREKARHNAAVKIQRGSQRYLLKKKRESKVVGVNRRRSTKAKIDKIQANVRGMLLRNQRLSELRTYVKELEDAIITLKKQISREGAALQSNQNEVVSNDVVKSTKELKNKRLSELTEYLEELETSLVTLKTQIRTETSIIQENSQWKPQNESIHITIGGGGGSSSSSYVGGREDQQGNYNPWKYAISNDSATKKGAAAIKLQAFIRGVLARIRVNALRAHIEFLNREQMRHHAALKIQRTLRKSLTKKKKQSFHKRKSTKEKIDKIQANVRGMLLRNQRLSELTKYVKELEGSIVTLKKQISRESAVFPSKSNEDKEKATESTLSLKNKRLSELTEYVGELEISLATLKTQIITETVTEKGISSPNESEDLGNSEDPETVIKGLKHRLEEKEKEFQHALRGDSRRNERYERKIQELEQKRIEEKNSYKKEINELEKAVETKANERLQSYRKEFETIIKTNQNKYKQEILELRNKLSERNMEFDELFYKFCEMEKYMYHSSIREGIYVHIKDQDDNNDGVIPAVVMCVHSDSTIDVEVQVDKNPYILRGLLKDDLIINDSILTLTKKDLIIGKRIEMLFHNVENSVMDWISGLIINITNNTNSDDENNNNGDDNIVCDIEFMDGLIQTDVSIDVLRRPKYILPEEYLMMDYNSFYYGWNESREPFHSATEVEFHFIYGKFWWPGIVMNIYYNKKSNQRTKGQLLYDIGVPNSDYILRRVPSHLIRCRKSHYGTTRSRKQSLQLQDQYVLDKVTDESKASESKKTEENSPNQRPNSRKLSDVSLSSPQAEGKSPTRRHSTVRTYSRPGERKNSIQSVQEPGNSGISLDHKSESPTRGRERTDSLVVQSSTNISPKRDSQIHNRPQWKIPTSSTKSSHHRTSTTTPSSDHKRHSGRLSSAKNPSDTASPTDKTKTPDRRGSARVCLALDNEDFNDSISTTELNNGSTLSPTQVFEASHSSVHNNVKKGGADNSVENQSSHRTTSTATAATSKPPKKTVTHPHPIDVEVYVESTLRGNKRVKKSKETQISEIRNKKAISIQRIMRGYLVRKRYTLITLQIELQRKINEKLKTLEDLKVTQQKEELKLQQIFKNLQEQQEKNDQDRLELESEKKKWGKEKEIQLKQIRIKFNGLETLRNNWHDEVNEWSLMFAEDMYAHDLQHQLLKVDIKDTISSKLKELETKRNKLNEIERQINHREGVVKKLHDELLVEIQREAKKRADDEAKRLIFMKEVETMYERKLQRELQPESSLGFVSTSNDKIATQHIDDQALRTAGDESDRMQDALKEEAATRIQRHLRRRSSIKKEQGALNPFSNVDDTLTIENRQDVGRDYNDMPPGVTSQIHPDQEVHIAGRALNAGNTTPSAAFVGDSMNGNNVEGGDESEDLSLAESKQALLDQLFTPRTSEDSNINKYSLSKNQTNDRVKNRNRENSVDMNQELKNKSLISVASQQSVDHLIKKQKMYSCVLIQKIFRGWRIRSKLHSGTEPYKKIHKQGRAWSVKKHEVEPILAEAERHQAEVLIQTRVRRHSLRRNLFLQSMDTLLQQQQLQEQDRDGYALFQSAWDGFQESESASEGSIVSLRSLVPTDHGIIEELLNGLPELLFTTISIRSGFTFEVYATKNGNALLLNGIATSDTQYWISILIPMTSQDSIHLKFVMNILSSQGTTESISDSLKVSISYKELMTMIEQNEWSEMNLITQKLQTPVSFEIGAASLSVNAVSIFFVRLWDAHIGWVAQMIAYEITIREALRTLIQSLLEQHAQATNNNNTDNHQNRRTSSQFLRNQQVFYQQINEVIKRGRYAFGTYNRQVEQILGDFVRYIAVWKYHTRALSEYSNNEIYPPYDYNNYESKEPWYPISDTLTSLAQESLASLLETCNAVIEIHTTIASTSTSPANTIESQFLYGNFSPPKSHTQPQNSSKLEVTKKMREALRSSFTWDKHSCHSVIFECFWSLLDQLQLSSVIDNDFIEGTVSCCESVLDMHLHKTRHLDWKKYCERKSSWETLIYDTMRYYAPSPRSLESRQLTVNSQIDFRDKFQEIVEDVEDLMFLDGTYRLQDLNLAGKNNSDRLSGGKEGQNPVTPIITADGETSLLVRKLIDLIVSGNYY